MHWGFWMAPRAVHAIPVELLQFLGGLAAGADFQPKRTRQPGSRRLSSLAAHSLIGLTFDVLPRSLARRESPVYAINRCTSADSLEYVKSAS